MTDSTRGSAAENGGWAARIPAPVAVGLIAGLTLGAFDVAVVLLGERSTSIAPLPALLFHTAGSMVVAWAIYAVLWILIGLPLKLVGKLPAATVSVVLVAGLAPLLVIRGAFAPVASLAAMFNPYRVVMLLGFSAAVGWSALYAAKAIATQEEIRRRFVTAAWVLPVLAMQVLVLVWLRIFQLRPGLGWKPIALYLGCLALMIATVAATRSARFRRLAPLAPVTIISVLLSVLGVYPLTLEPAIETHAAPFSQEHSVKRVILITIDTLRWDALTIYNPASQLTPNLAALAQDSVVFDRAFAPSPWTLPSMASIMSGLSTLVHGVSKENPGFPHGAPLLGDLLGDAGYVTGALGGNTLLQRQRALARGFQAFHFPRGAPAETLAKAGLMAVVGRATLSGQQMTEWITRFAEDWTRANRDNDFLLWVHYLDPHSPYLPPEEFIPNRELAPGLDMGYRWNFRAVRNGDVRMSLKRQAWVQELYRAEVRYVDDRIGRYLGTLKELGLYDDSLIIVTNDHGEEFWDHGSVDHGHTLYNEMIQAPLIIKLPSSTPPPARRQVDNYVSTVSLLPTILELCGIGYKPEDFSARSLTPLWAGEAEVTEDRPLFISKLVYYQEQEAVLHGGWKYIQVLGRDEEQLYDMNADPGETMNVAVSEVARKAELLALLEEHRTASRALAERHGLRSPDTAAQQDRVREQLRSLGYIQ